MRNSLKPIKLVLLKSTHFLERNNYNKPVVGWYQTSDGFGSLQNSDIGLACMRVVHQNQNQNGEYQNLYDSMRIFENLGVVLILMRDDCKIALIKQYRMIGERLPNFGVDYTANIENKNKWAEAVDSLGAWTWELPKGISSQEYRYQNADNNKTQEEHILEIAKAEASEEAGIIFEDYEIIGYINPHTTYFAYRQPVMLANVSQIINQKPEIYETIGEVEFFSIEEIADLIKQGQLVDGLSLASLGMVLCILKLNKF